jgi:hypothetical protein
LIGADLQTYTYTKWLNRNGRAKAVRGMIEARDDTAAREAVIEMMDADERRKMIGLDVDTLSGAPNTQAT